MYIIIIIIVVTLRFQSTDSWLHCASGEGELPSPQHAQQGMCDLISLGVSENVHCVAWLVLSVRKSTWLGLTVSENGHCVAWLVLSVRKKHLVRSYCVRKCTLCGLVRSQCIKKHTHCGPISLIESEIRFRV